MTRWTRRSTAIFAIILAAVAVSACSGNQESTLPFVIDGVYAAAVRVVASQDPAFPVGTELEEFPTFTTVADGVAVSFPGTFGNVTMRRSGNTLRYDGDILGCASTARITWSTPNRFTGSAEDACSGLVVRYVIEGERLTD